MRTDIIKKFKAEAKRLRISAQAHQTSTTWAEYVARGEVLFFQRVAYGIRKLTKGLNGDVAVLKMGGHTEVQLGYEGLMKNGKTPIEFLVRVKPKSLSNPDEVVVDCYGTINQEPFNKKYTINARQLKPSVVIDIFQKVVS